MSYVTPSVLVYQQLASSGGVANVTPDLDAVIIGPCYNVLTYDGTSESSLVLTSGLNQSGAPYRVTDNTVENVVTLPGQKDGQNVEENSVAVFLNNAVVESLSTRFLVTPGSNRVVVVTDQNLEATAATGSTTTGSPVVTGITSSVFNLAIGDSVVIAEAGTPSGGSPTSLSALIIDVDTTGNTITLDVNAGATVSSTTISKTSVSNVNQATSTKKVSAGDSVVVTYDPPESAVVTFSTSVSTVEEVSGNLVSIHFADIIPDAAGSIGIDVPSLVSIRKSLSNQPLLKVLDESSNYSDDTVGATGEITILPYPKLSYGTVVEADVHIQYRALRTDLSGNIVDIESATDLVGQLGAVSDLNPLALGVQLAQANAVGRILAVGVASEDLAGYQQALELIEGRRVYAIAPLTQDTAIIAAVKQHVVAFSTPEEAAWRTAIVNSAIPTTTAIGPWTASNVNANTGNNEITLVSGAYILTASNATFLTDGAVAGDTIHITAGTGTTSQVGQVRILSVLSNQQVRVSATDTATGVSYYVTRLLTKNQQAESVAATCITLGTNRVTYVPQGSIVTINGVAKNLPGYYYCAAIAGLVSGLPVQQSLTNIGVAGITGVQYGNFYFTSKQLGTMAAAGACLIVQETQTSIPYIRHSLTTDMTTLYFREMQQVKNWDYLSYFFHDILKGFIGRYNITPDTLRILGQTITSGGRLLQGKKLPKIGAPLLDFSIKTLKQDDTNKDSVIVEMPIQMPVVLNYLNLYLIV